MAIFWHLKRCWNAFEVCTDNKKTLSPVEKFTHLNSKLLGDAQKAIEGFSLCSVNLFSTTTGFERKIWRGVASEIFTLHSSNWHPYAGNLQCFLSDKSVWRNAKSFRCLESLAQAITSPVFLSIILSKLQSCSSFLYPAVS